MSNHSRSPKESSRLHGDRVRITNRRERKTTAENQPSDTAEEKNVEAFMDSDEDDEEPRE